MVDPVASLGFGRLRSLLQSEPTAARVKQARRAVLSPDIERVALSPGFPARIRLAALAALVREATKSPFPERDRADIVAELERLSLRILWHEGLLADSPRRPRPPAQVAEALLQIAAAGLLPEGAVGRMALERARALLRHHDSVLALQADPALRDRLTDLLAAAFTVVRMTNEAVRTLPLEA